MILQVIVGALVARKVIKVVRREVELQRLQEYGEKLGYPMIPGESPEEYKQKLQQLRDQNKL